MLQWKSGIKWKINAPSFFIPFRSPSVKFRCDNCLGWKTINTRWPIFAGKCLQKCINYNLIQIFLSWWEESLLHIVSEENCYCYYYCSVDGKWRRTTGDFNRRTVSMELLHIQRDCWGLEQQQQPPFAMVGIHLMRCCCCFEPKTDEYERALIDR